MYLFSHFTNFVTFLAHLAEFGIEHPLVRIDYILFKSSPRVIAIV